MRPDPPPLIRSAWTTAVVAPLRTGVAAAAALGWRGACGGYVPWLGVAWGLVAAVPLGVVLGLGVHVAHGAGVGPWWQAVGLTLVTVAVALGLASSADVAK